MLNFSLPLALNYVILELQLRWQMAFRKQQAG
jgi:hypothetical protein